MIIGSRHCARAAAASVAGEQGFEGVDLFRLATLSLGEVIEIVSASKLTSESSSLRMA